MKTCEFTRVYGPRVINAHKKLPFNVIISLLILPSLYYIILFYANC